MSFSFSILSQRLWYVLPIFFLFACLFILICTFLLHLLVNLDVGLFILVIFLKELTLFIDSLYFSLCFYFIDLSLQFYYFLLPISLAVPRFWYQDFSYVVKFLVWDIMETFFFIQILSAMKFPLSTAFIVFHKFGYAVYSLLLIFRKSLISFWFPFLFSPLPLSFDFLFFPLSVLTPCVILQRVVHFFLFCKFSVVSVVDLQLLCSDRMQGVISFFLNLLRLDSCLNQYMSILNKVPGGTAFFFVWLKYSVNICQVHLV